MTTHIITDTTANILNEEFKYNLNENKEDNTLLNCEFCSNEFKSLSALNAHKKYTKYCIKIQNENKEEKIVKFICEDCLKESTTKQNLQNLQKHYLTCNAKRIREIKDTHIEQKDLEIKELKKQINLLNSEIEIYRKDYDTIHKIANKPKNKKSVLKIVSNIDFLKYMETNIKDIFDKSYSIKTFLDCEKSLAHFIIDNLLSGKNCPIYLCVDKARYKFAFHNDNETTYDSNAQILIKLIINYGLDSIKNLYNKYVKIAQKNNKNPFYLRNLENIFIKLSNLKTDNKIFLTYLRDLLPKTLEEREIRDRLNEIKNEDVNIANEIDIDRFVKIEDVIDLERHQYDDIEEYINQQTLLNCINALVKDFNCTKEEFEGDNTLYFSFIGLINGKIAIKYGESSVYIEREKKHGKNTDFNRFDVICVVRCGNSSVCEALFRQVVSHKKLKYLTYNEIIYIDNVNELLKFRNCMKYIGETNLNEFVKRYT